MKALIKTAVAPETPRPPFFSIPDCAEYQLVLSKQRLLLIHDRGATNLDDDMPCQLIDRNLLLVQSQRSLHVILQRHYVPVDFPDFGLM